MTNKQITELLKQIGLTENESKCYLFLLKDGPMTVQELSRKSGIHRVNLYTVVNGLISKKVVDYEVKNKYRKKLIPKHPRVLLESLYAQQRVLKKAELKFKQVLPELAGFLKQRNTKTEVRFFDGLEGVKQVFDNVLTATTQIKGFSNVEILDEFIDREWMDDYRKRKSDLGLTGMFIVPAGEKSRNYVKEAYLDYGLANYPQLKVLPMSIFDVLAEMDVYDNKVAIISFSKEDQFGIIIESQIVAKSFEAIFDTLWKFAQNP